MKTAAYATSPSASGLSWTEANQRYLVAEFARLHDRLTSKHDARAEAAVLDARGQLASPPAIDRLSSIFDLSPFERDILLLCAGVEMDSALAAVCGEATGSARWPAVTFALAMATLPDPHWSALTPARPLRRFRLVEMESSHGVTSAPLRIDERILHYLAGVNLADGVCETRRALPVALRGSPTEHKPIAGMRLCALLIWMRLRHTRCISAATIPGPGRYRHDAAAQTGRQLFRLRAEDLPAPGAELDQFLSVMGRAKRYCSRRVAGAVRHGGLSHGSQPRGRAATRLADPGEPRAFRLNRPGFASK